MCFVVPHIADEVKSFELPLPPRNRLSGEVNNGSVLVGVRTSPMPLNMNTWKGIEAMQSRYIDSYSRRNFSSSNATRDVRNIHNQAAQKGLSRSIRAFRRGKPRAVML